MEPLLVRPVAFIRSPLRSIEDAPLQGDEGAPEALLEAEPSFAPCFEGITVGDELLVLTWLHLGRRDLLQVHPRGDPARPLTGVFATRAPHRPNPIGLHRVQVLGIDASGHRLRVSAIEALDGTPVIDLKPVLGAGDR